MSKTVACVISTKDRINTSLPLTISSVLNQTVKPNKLIIFNDGDDFNPNDNPLYKKLLQCFIYDGISWFFLYGKKKGQVFNHQDSLSTAETDLIWRIDDDEIAKPDTLEKLIRHFDDDSVAAAAGLVEQPVGLHPCPSFVSGRIEDILLGQNLQWYSHQQNTPLEVDHLYSTFIFRRDYANNVGGYFTNLSQISHREETFFTYKLRKNNYKLLIDPTVVTRHLSLDSGGIRLPNSIKMWESDESKFRAFMHSCGVKLNEYILVSLKGGIGDHYAFKHIYPELKTRNINKRIMIFCVYPQVFWNLYMDSVYPCKEIDAFNLNMGNYDVYEWMARNNWTGPLYEAFRKMYNL